MAGLAPGSAHAWPSVQPPIDTSRNFPAWLHNDSVGLCIVYVLVWQTSQLNVERLRSMLPGAVPQPLFKLLIFSWNWIFEKYDALFHLHTKIIYSMLKKKKLSLSYIKKIEVVFPFKFLLVLMGVLAPGSAHVSAKSPAHISPNQLKVISKVSES